MSADDPATSPFSALLLAGGRSRRMGRDKALLEWQGRPLWEVQVEKLRELQPARLMVACREEQRLHESAARYPEVEWLFDPPGEDLGPLAAITRALDGLTTPLLALAVDMPWMTAEFLRDHLLGADGGRFYQGPQGYEPLAGIYVPAMRETMARALESGRLGLQPVIEAAVAADLATVRQIPEDAQPLFHNANTRVEWDAASAH